MSVLSNRPIKQTRPGGDKRDRDIVLASTPSFERRLEAARPVSLSLVLDGPGRMMEASLFTTAVSAAALNLAITPDSAGQMAGYGSSVIWVAGLVGAGIVSDVAVS